MNSPVALVPPLPPAAPSVSASSIPAPAPAPAPASAPAPPASARRRAAGWARHRRAPGRPSADAEPVRLAAAVVPNPFAPGREVAFSRVVGSLLERVGVRDGDHVALCRRGEAEHGDLAAVVDETGRAALWRVYPEGDALRLSTGDSAHARRTAPHPRVHGVVVGVLRRFG